VYRHLKPNSVVEFTGTKGFQDEITFVAPSGTEAFAISLWDREERAEAYPEVTKLLAAVIDGPRQVETFNIAHSAFHNLPPL